MTIKQLGIAIVVWVLVLFGVESCSRKMQRDYDNAVQRREEALQWQAHEAAMEEKRRIDAYIAEQEALEELEVKRLIEKFKKERAEREKTNDTDRIPPAETP